MTYWLTSHNRKVHQRAINKLVRAINKKLTQDDLWHGRFMICQSGSPQWKIYDDGSGAELYVCLKFIDRATGREYFKADSVNRWRGFCANGYRIWEIRNWLITEHWNVWKESFAKDKDMTM